MGHMLPYRTEDIAGRHRLMERNAEEWARASGMVPATIPARFMRVHRSALVNVARVQRLDRLEGGELVIVLQSGIRVPVSRARRASVMRELRVR